MAEDKKEGLALLISAGNAGKKEKSKEGKEDEEYSDDTAKEDASADLLKAIKDEDSKAVAEAIETLISLCSDEE